MNIQKVKDYQIESIQFVWSNICGTENGSGCLLALEMGLGKTLCSIAVITTFLKNNIGKRVLVVVPATVVQNWEDEFAKWLIDVEDKINIFKVQKIAKAVRLKFVQVK